jgi:molybdopterin/thiamine biosynthesis adenylyltransferase
MKTPLSLTIDEPLFQRLYNHLFPGDGDEHGAVIAAGIVEGARGTRLLARDLFLARDGIDYVASARAYRALTADFVAQQADYCFREHLCYLAIHCHGGSDSVSFSPEDNASHERGYPALLDITRGGPVGALVLASNAAAGDIWTPTGRFPLSHITVVGRQIRRLYPHPTSRLPKVPLIYDRHARLFGDVGQGIIGQLKVGIIGLGGGGSLLNEWLARLGVGHIVAIDPQKIDVTNLPRVVGASRWDAMAPLVTSRIPWLRRLGDKLARNKVDIARRVAKQANSAIRYDAVVGTILDEATALLLTDVDFLLLATDNIQSRLVFNALVHQYLIPGAQVGVKVTTNQLDRIEDINIASRLVLPHQGGGCLECNGLIPPGRLQSEALTNQERRAQRYVEAEDVPEPSVITLNAVSAAQIANDIMMMVTGLYEDGAHMGYRVQSALTRKTWEDDLRSEGTCLDCGHTSKSRRARGDRARLPCRMPKVSSTRK